MAVIKIWTNCLGGVLTLDQNKRRKTETLELYFYKIMQFIKNVFKKLIHP